MTRASNWNAEQRARTARKNHRVADKAKRDAAHERRRKIREQNIGRLIKTVSGVLENIEKNYLNRQYTDNEYRVIVLALNQIQATALRADTGFLLLKTKTTNFATLVKDKMEKTGKSEKISADLVERDIRGAINTLFITYPDLKNILSKLAPKQL